MALVFLVLLAYELAQWRALSSEGMRAADERRRLTDEIRLREEQMAAELRARAPVLGEMRWTAGAADPGTFLTRLAELAGDKRVKVVAVGPLERQVTPQWEKSWHAIQVVAPYREIRELAARIEAERGILEDVRLEPAPAPLPPAGRPGAPPPVDEVHARFRMTALELSAPSKRLVERALGAGSGAPRSAPTPPAPLARDPFTFVVARPPAAPAPPAPRVEAAARAARAERHRGISRRLSRHREQSGRQDRRRGERPRGRGDHGQRRLIARAGRADPDAAASGAGRSAPGGAEEVSVTMRSRTQMLRALSGLALVLLLPGGPAAAQPRDACAGRLPAERVTLNLRDASVPTALRLLAQQYKVNMLVTDDVRGQVTLDFFRVPAHDVFQAIIDAGNLRCVVSGDVLRVSTMTRLRTEEEDRVKAREGELRLEADTRKKIVEARRAEEELAELAARGPIREETIRLHYADAEDVAKTLQGILGIAPQGTGQAAVPLPQLSQLYVPSPPIDIPSSPPPPLTAPSPSSSPPSEIVAKGLTVQAYKPTNSLFIRYYEKDIERLKKLVQERLDIPVPQVQIAAQMVITSLNALEQIGVQWGGAGAGNVGRSTFVGQGFQDAVRVPGTGAINVNPVNPNLNLGGLLPVNPATAHAARRQPRQPAHLAPAHAGRRHARGRPAARHHRQQLQHQPRHPGPRGAGQGPHARRAQDGHRRERQGDDQPGLRGAVRQHARARG